jgi:hypothetical protein
MGDHVGALLCIAIVGSVGGCDDREGRWARDQRPIPSATFRCDKIECTFPKQGCYDTSFDCYFEQGSSRKECEARNHGRCFAVSPEEVIQGEDGDWYHETRCELASTSNPKCHAAYCAPTDG